MFQNQLQHQNNQQSPLSLHFHLNISNIRCPSSHHRQQKFCQAARQFFFLQRVGTVHLQFYINCVLALRPTPKNFSFSPNNDQTTRHDGCLQPSPPDGPQRRHGKSSLFFPLVWRKLSHGGMHPAPLFFLIIPFHARKHIQRSPRRYELRQDRQGRLLDLLESCKSFPADCVVFTFAPSQNLFVCLGQQWGLA